MTTRVLFRFHAGLPFRQASEEDRKQCFELWDDMLEKWKTSGVKLIGSFGSPAHVDGFANYLIFEVEDTGLVTEMDHDIQMGDAGQLIEDFQFHVGTPRTRVEEIWA